VFNIIRRRCGIFVNLLQFTSALFYLLNYLLTYLKCEWNKTNIKQKQEIEELGLRQFGNV